MLITHVKLNIEEVIETEVNKQFRTLLMLCTIYTVQNSNLWTESDGGIVAITD